MERAKNLSTNETVKAMQVYNDQSYLTPKEDKWIAPEDEILNLDELKKKGIKEIEVRYNSEGRKSYKKKEGFFRIRPHFKIKNKEKLGIITNPRDLLHDKLSNWLFNYILQKEPNLKLIYSTYHLKGSKKEHIIHINELPVDKQTWNTEVTIENGKKVRADIYIKFNKKSLLFGEGIIFEIQLGKQKDQTYKERTLDRAILGYSVCWLSKTHFEEDEEEFILKDEKLVLSPFAEILKEQSKKTFKKWQDITQENSRIINKKILQQQETIQKQYNILFTQYKKYIDIIDEKKEELNGILEENKEILAEIKRDSFDDFKKKHIDIIQKLDEDGLLSEIENHIKERINLDFINDVKGDVKVYANDQIDLLKIKIENKLQEFEVIKYVTEKKCPKCEGVLVFHPTAKYGSFIGCSNWKSGCQFKISLNYFKMYGGH